MAEAEAFLARWSRLKRAEDLPPPEREAVAVAEAVEPGCEPAEPDHLPPLDSLCADSDYTGFLREGVPEPLQTLALRKAWATDPAIAGFRGFAEYDWDCNAQGFAALLPTDDVVRLCEAVLGPPPAEATEEDAPVQVAAVPGDNAAADPADEGSAA